MEDNQIIKFLPFLLILVIIGLIATFLSNERMAAQNERQIVLVQNELTQAKEQNTRVQEYLAQTQGQHSELKDLIERNGNELRDLGSKLQELATTVKESQTDLQNQGAELHELADALASLRSQFVTAVAERSLPARSLGKPHPLNIDFGVWKPAASAKVGPAAVGKQGDFWNTVAVAWNDDHTETGLKWTNGENSPVAVRMVNLGGGWGNSGGMGVKDPMLDGFNYPANNKGGNSQVVLNNIPPGTYDLYLYGHGTNPAYYGDYTLRVGDKEFGRKATSNQPDAVTSSRWQEGKQYVKFSGIVIPAGAGVEILIQPGGQVSDNGRRQFTDAMICGLQLVAK